MLRSLSLAIFGSLALLVSACSDDASVVDSPQGTLPSSFANLTLSSQVFDTDTISVFPGRDKLATDPVTIALFLRVDERAVDGVHIASARCTITTEPGGRTVSTVDLRGPVAGRFADTVRMQIARGDVGDYRVTVTGRDARGQETNEMRASLRVMYGLRAPDFCSDVVAPDTIMLPAADSLITLELCVSDSSGLKDIRTVFFNSYLPTGAPSRDNPILMRDDGYEGDRIARDGIYTRRVLFPSNAARGTYRFEFQAIDASNLSSRVLIHRLHVR